MTEEITNSGGGSTSYYKLEVKGGVTFGDYSCECQDIIEALNMTWNEANNFKSIWRKAAARQGNKKAGYDSGLRDAEKSVFSSQRELELVKRQSVKSSVEQMVPAIDQYFVTLPEGWDVSYIPETCKYKVNKNAASIFFMSDNLEECVKLIKEYEEEQA